MDPAKYDLLYPPLFIYIISAPGIINIDLVFLPLFIADLLTPVILYKFLKNIFNEKIAKWGFILFIFSPLNKLYTGALFLNTY